mgnify:CR=1 FL=1
MIQMFLLNIFLAVLWMFMWGGFDFYTLAAGLVVGYLLLGLLARIGGRDGYGTKVIKLISFSLYFIRILVKANWVVAKELITPGYGMTPRFVRYSVEGMTDFQITTLANSITLTPGTLSVDVSDDGQWLYVHCMYAQSREQAIRDLDELRDRLVEEVFN